jgi:hypothetical protein
MMPEAIKMNTDMRQEAVLLSAEKLPAATRGKLLSSLLETIALPFKLRKGNGHYES